MQTTVSVEHTPDRADIVLTAPAGKPPTLDHAVLESLEKTVIALESAPPRIVVVRSASPKYFCVGANVRALEQITEETIVPWVELGHRVFNRLEDLPCPVVARVSGYAMGGGLELAMSCDTILASEDARFAQSEATLGFIPGWGGTFRLVERVGLAQAKKLFFTGAVLEAGAALSIGLVDQVSAPADLDAAVRMHAAAVAGNSALALTTFKRMLHHERREARERAAHQEAHLSRVCTSDPDSKLRLQRFLEKRK